MKSQLKRLIDKVFMRDVIFELRQELKVMRQELAQAQRSLRALDTDLRRTNYNLGLVLQDVAAGHEALSDQILESRKEIAALVSEPASPQP